MNKQAARKVALEGKMSVGDLRRIISAKRGVGGMSRVNPAIPLERALDIYDAALAGHADEDVPEVWRVDPYSRRGTKKPTGAALTITNILRDCNMEREPHA